MTSLEKGMARFQGALFALVFVVSPSVAAEPGVTLIDPSTLARRTDLLNRPVAVDDRIARFQWHKETDYDEIYLKRTSVVFRLPPRLRFTEKPRSSVVRVEGILRREGDALFCDVSALQLYPSDLDRLERAVSTLVPNDAEGRSAWARWADRRAREYDDPKDAALVERAQVLEAEALAIEAERTTPDRPRQWLELARRGRLHLIPEPVPSALAHRAFAARLASARGVGDLEGLVADIAGFWPASATPPVANADLDAWLAPYANDPAAAYRLAPESVRPALDHRLWADATQRLVELRMAAEPGRALELAQEASTALGDRPQVVHDLIEKGLKEATRNLGALRQGDVEALARLYRETLHRPDAAKGVLRRWLDEQRDHRLSSTDAEGRVLLADQYQALIDDRESAIALLQDAWRIDPQSKDVADAFRRREFRRVDDRWVPSSRTRSDAGTEPGVPPGTLNASQSAGLRGLTPREVRARLGGKPDRIVRSATQGQLVEQWIYHGVDQDQYLNFVRSAGDPLPKVVAYYARPRSRLNAQPPR